MNLINIEIKGSNLQIEKFIRKLTENSSGALVFTVTRIPCSGEIIQLGTPDLRTEFFRVTGVIHYTFPSSSSSWGCITVEPCNLFSRLSDEDEYLEVVDEDEDFELLDEDEYLEVVDEDEYLEVVDEDEYLEVVDEFDLDDGSLPSPSQRRYFRRIPRGICTPEEAYKLPILKALDELGGLARTKDVLALVKKLMKGVLNKTDYLEYKYKNITGVYTVVEPRWQKRTKWVRYKLMKEGLVKSDSRRGVWEISEAGYQYLAEHENSN